MTRMLKHNPKLVKYAKDRKRVLIRIEAIFDHAKAPKGWKGFGTVMRSCSVSPKTAAKMLDLIDKDKRPGKVEERG